ncbi:hypothetical protein SADUNF_Sadunf06G0129300 [Salix dunnii]|uniref:Uncharacterized protein n=1 Tax=Salix dunnii TaxID=1413687 RepID=A0A835K1P3_9ROSI|nr:hypothetical protein SADUNF_Sadunf06G0129300 [Salix dunnii]
MSAIVFRYGRELLFKTRFLIDQAVVYWTRQGIKSISSRKRLPRSGMWPPPYRMAILLWPLLIALLRASMAALFLSPMMTDSSSEVAFTCVNLQNTQPLNQSLKEPVSSWKKKHVPIY